jgi:outer membrane protein
MGREWIRFGHTTLLVGIALAPALCFADPPSNQTRPRLRLDEAIGLALKHHPTLFQAEATKDAANARTESARAPALPQVTAQGQYQRTTDNTVPRRPTAADPSWNGNTFNRFSLGASASQLIYDFGQTTGRWDAAAANEEAAKSNEQALRTQLVTTVRRTYFQAKAQEDLTAVAEDTLINQEKHAQQIERLVQVGMRPEIDRLSAETNVANARVQWITAQNAYELACTTFTQSLGLPATPGYAPGNDDLPPLAEEKAAVSALIEKALAQRNELVTFAKQRKSLEATLQASEGAMRPSLVAQANVSAGGAELGHLVPNGWLGALINWPIFQGGESTAHVREARANLQILRAQEDTFRLQVRIEVEQAALNLQAARSVLEASHTALFSAQKQLQLAESRYTAGLGSVIELDDAQVRTTQAAAQNVNARYALASARATLRGALGIP